MQDSGLELTASVLDSGVKCTESLANYDRDTSLSKTSQPCSQVVDGKKNQMINAYAAGLIDGEGCISIAHRDMKSFSARIDVGMSSKGMPCLVRLKDHFGGQIRKTRHKSEKWEEAHAWALFGKTTVPFLEAILPHLVLKKEQAEYALALQRMIAKLPLARKGTAQWSQDAIAEATCIRALMQELNRKGPEIEATDGWIARLVGGKWITPQRDMFSSLQWAEFSETFPKSGMTRNGRLYRLPTLERRISENESGLWPTPTAQNAKHLSLSPSERDRVSRGIAGLHAMVHVWPMPAARDYRSESCSLEFQEKRNAQTRGKPLSWEVHQFHTPRTTPRTAMEYDGVTPLGNGGLNPTFVEFLMGYPRDWTEV